LRSIVVFGAGGLLGRAITNELKSSANPADEIRTARVNWQEPAQAKSQFSKYIRNWLDDSGNASRELYWCAGRGGPRADHLLIAEEEMLFKHLLTEIEAGRPDTSDGTLRVFFSSSAGGIYGDTGDDIATELTSPRPAGLYGEAKLRLESALQDFVTKTHCTAVIGRISSIYGVGRSLRGRQGLLGHMAFSIANHRPISLFTSLSTARNYIDVESAARLAVALLRDSGDTTLSVRNINSPYSPSIAELLVLARQLAGGRLLFQQERLLTTEQSRIATVFPEPSTRLLRTTLAEGFSRLIRAERVRAIAGASAANP
jgi:UDP-glucose 4-epimerase